MMNEKTKPKERYNDDEEEYDDRSVSERREVGGGNRYRDDGDRDKGRNRDGGRGGNQPDKNRDRFKDGKISLFKLIKPVHVMSNEYLILGVIVLGA
jgi:hypothetical protein